MPQGLYRLPGSLQEMVSLPVINLKMLLYGLTYKIFKSKIPNNYQIYLIFEIQKSRDLHIKYDIQY